jgi:hypothetical protein
MLPNFLLPETEVQKDGEGPVVPLDDAAGKTLQLTLGITDAIEQESVEVSVYGSADSSDWTAKPLAAFPPKFYKGIYTIVLDLSQAPDIQFLRVKYKVGRWGHWTAGPEFRCYVFAETVSS